jgi:hypothetical protein
MPLRRKFAARPSSAGLSAFLAEMNVDVRVGFCDQDEMILLRIPRWRFSLLVGFSLELRFPLSPFGHCVPFFVAF